MGAGTYAVDGGLAEPHGTSLPCAPMSTELRPAEAGDVTLLLDLVRRLAEAQDAGGYVESTAEDLLRDGFGTAPRFHAVLAEQVDDATGRSEEQTSELQSLMRISYADFCLKKKK